jgi:hypothetical protein
MEGNNERVLPIVDTSGSMCTSAGGNDNVSCLDVSVSLGLYISERNEGAFKDAFVTFSDNPVLQYVKGNLKQRFDQLARSDWGYSTNLEAVFRLILKKGAEGNVPESEMPTMVLILSDMEFNEGTGGGYRGEHSKWNPTAQQMIEKMYADAGYKMPKVVYWNIQSRNKNNPVQFDKQGTALVSGFSPALLTGLLGGEDLTPYSMMMKIIGGDRYEPITVK